MLIVYVNEDGVPCSHDELLTILLFEGDEVWVVAQLLKRLQDHPNLVPGKAKEVLNDDRRECA